MWNTVDTAAPSVDATPDCGPMSASVASNGDSSAHLSAKLLHDGAHLVRKRAGVQHRHTAVDGPPGAVAGKVIAEAALHRLTDACRQERQRRGVPSGARLFEVACAVVITLLRSKQGLQHRAA